MTQSAFSQATDTNNKKLYLIVDATHIETYWVPRYVDEALSQRDPFFDQNLSRWAAK